MAVIFRGLSGPCVFRKLVFLTALFTSSIAQGQKYDLFEISNDDLYWHNTYKYPGSADSLRREVVQMLKSKFFTFNVIRNETGYNGEIKHYSIDCKRYGRRYATTPGVYWEGEWTGKFIVEVADDAYRVTVYALYGEKKEKKPLPYHRMTHAIGGRFIDLVTRSDHSGFRKTELSNVALMSASLKDAFDITRTVVPQGEK
jgi:hypothetical protein